MAKNPLTTSRSRDKMFESDTARESRRRGNTEEYDTSALRRNSLILAVFSFLLFYFATAFLVGFTYSMIKTGILETPEMAKMLKVTEPISVKDAVMMMCFSLPQLLFPLLIGLIMMGVSVYLNVKYGKRQAVTQDHTDLNTYKGDRHIQELTEIVQNFEAFPDAGAHSKTVSPSSIVAHLFLDNNRKIPKVKLAKRDENGEFIKDKNGNNILEEFDMFDSERQPKVFESVGILNKKEQKEKIFDPFSLNYKKKKNGKWMTLGEFIKEDWYIPEYENARPTGAFFVETSAVNTIAIAITRGNKGQLVVNNTIDNLSREADPQNMFINDPKGELFAGFHKLLELRGIEPIVLNLMEPSKTHQFNVLGPAVFFARMEDYDQMRSSLNTVMNTFFPVEGDDPFWGNAQQTLVRMIIFAMIDYYIEEEKEYIQLYAGHKDESTIARELDQMWSHVTMFNVYQMLTSMSRNEVKWNPDDFAYKPEGEGDILGEEDLPTEQEEEDEGEQMTQLTAFLKLLDKLPQNKMRTIAMQQSDAMDVMAESEKTRATVYGIALVAMLFFTDGPITAITSASPRQTLDPMSLAFPRRLRFKVNQSFLQEHGLAGKTVIFESFRDEAMTDKIEQGEDFEHKAKLNKLGWVEYRFKGIYQEYEELENYDGSTSKVAKPIYIRMKIINNKNDMTMYTFNFEFKRGYAKTVDGSRFVQNPRTGERIEQGGTLRLGEVVTESKQGYNDRLSKMTNPDMIRDIIVRFGGGEMPKDMSLDDLKEKATETINKSSLPDKSFFRYNQQMKKLPNGMKVLPIEQTDAVYNVRPKAIFSITPPHLTDYIKIVIMMVAVLFDTSVGESYLTKASGKPFYKTRSILDELGNMQFNGNGIPDFQTKLSIGLGQGQEYTMILQTLQQLRDVYGESVDKIVSANTAVFIYLISNDTDMLEDLSKQAGNTHAVRASQKTVNKKVGTLVDTLDENVSYNYSVQEERLFTVDELMSFTNGEAMVLSTVKRQDNSRQALRPNPIYNTDATVLPMAYALHTGGHNSDIFKTELANAEVSTSSSGQDVYKTIPDFNEMYRKRKMQAVKTERMFQMYKESENLTDTDLMRVDVDIVSNAVMRLINAETNKEMLAKREAETLEEDRSAELDEFENAEEEFEAQLDTEDAGGQDFLTAKERRILENNNYDTTQDDYKVNDMVDDKDKMYQENIKESEAQTQQDEAAQREKIYLDGRLSYNDLRNNQAVYDDLAIAFADANAYEDVDKSLYEYRTEGSDMMVLDKHTKTCYMKFESKMDSGESQEEGWVVTDEFKKKILDVAATNSAKVTKEGIEQTPYALNKEDVDRRFDMDVNGLVKKNFIELLDKEDFGKE